MNRAFHGVACLIFSLAAAPVVAEAPLQPFKTAGGRLGFLVPGAVSPEGLRVLVDEADAPGGFAPWGIDRMSEGASVYRYPDGEQAWRWENEGSVTFVVQSNVMAMVLPNIPAQGRFRWIAEWYDDQWQVSRRYPAEGIATNDADALPPAPAWFDPRMPDIAELIRFSPTSLSRRLQRDYIDGTWRTVDPMPALPSLALPGVEARAELVLAWTDPRSGRTVSLSPQSAGTDGARTRWRGATPDGDAWFLVADSAAPDAMEVVAWVQAERERVFRLSLGARFPDGEWTWFDDMHAAVALKPGQRHGVDGPSPYGLLQRRSHYPFGVIATEQAVLIAETDGREPRHFQIEAATDERVLWIHYDLAATPLTGHFPGRAAVRAHFRAEPRTDVQPFRAALRTLYERDPAWWVARTPRHGLWMPFTDIGAVSNASDFGFAFFEKVGPHGADLDNARAVGAYNLIYTEPWLYWLPLANTSEWNRAAAVRRMEELARNAVGKEREFASAGLLGATRDAAQQPRIQFLATPWSTGARMEVITDPELPVTSNATVNRAMAEWRFIRESLEDPRADGIYLDSLSAMETIDYNPAALSVADHPPTFVLADLKPGVATPIQAVEFTAALAGYLRSRGQYLMANFPCWRFPFFMPYIDIPGEETTWYTGRQYTPMSERERNYRRAISGAKPFGFLQATHFTELSLDDMEKYFRDCLALGLLPSFFSHDGANDPYWVDASLYERDRPLFRRYLPLTIRLSEAGWVPVADAVFSAPEVQVEQFGKSTDDVRWITLRNTGARPATGVLRARDGAGERIAYAVDSGHVYPTLADAPEIELEPGAVAVWALLAPGALRPEAAWFRRHAAHHAQYRAAAANLESFAREHERGLRADVVARTVAPMDEQVDLALLLEADGAWPMQFLHISGDNAGVGVARDLVARERLEVSMPNALDARAGRWARVRWQMQVDGRPQVYERIVLPPTRPDILFDGPDGRFVAGDDEALLVFSVTNRGARARTITLHATGDLPGARLEWSLPPGGSTQALVRVEAHDARMRRVVTRWELDGRTEREHEVFVIFAPPLDHLATKAGVRVTADSAYSGYTTAPIHDGVLETAGLIWHDAAFASAETSEPHWIRIQFPAPETVSSVTAHWNAEGGVLYASRRGEVWGQLSDGRRVKLGAFDGASAGSSTRVSFAPVSVGALEWRQPSSGGSAARPDLLWVVELEVR
ncbi:MAG TPA: hypothetical protein PKE12_02540 [Kiritimatiellia bacterium]|nr:hypothetical protein [Kiritimatiellia bacterium]